MPPVGDDRYLRRLLLIRHGESVGNVAATAAEAEGLEVVPVQQRDADVPLSSLGAAQANALGPVLASAFAAGAHVWSSPYLRAVSTAQNAIAASGVPLGYAIDERLRDRELGILDTLTRYGVRERLPQEASRRTWLGSFYYRPPGGESWADVALRLRSFLRDALDDGPARDAATSIIFAHDAVVSLFVYICLSLTESELNDFLLTRVVHNASVTELTQHPDGRWTVDSFSDDRHVAAAGLPVTRHPGQSHDAPR